MRRWTRSDTQCRRRRAVGEGAAAAQKLGGGGHGGEKSRGSKRRRTATLEALKCDQEGRRSHTAAFSTPARSRTWPRARLEDVRSSPSVRCRPKTLFIEITKLPLVYFSKLLPNLYGNSKISKNKSCSKFKVLQLCLNNHTLIRFTF